ncbi:nucleoside diphosphate kinase regulator [Luteimonas abyssi]|uniref:nucleoside diphosphate kinase regulator n=1 Tax=Luteimonas abyssi TaxID=1247514 RepID=UPI000737CBE1|nr:nucleoside diphosphate kinase regulator [Luteimonas abyssi]
MSNPHSGLPPSLLITERDAARLDALLENDTWRDQPAAKALQQELLRARVVPAADMPDDVVRMHSQVDSVDADGVRRTLTLVYPHEADADTHRVSVLAPVGSALLGLSVGQSIDWPRPGGGTLHLEVVAVTAAVDTAAAVRG